MDALDLFDRKLNDFDYFYCSRLCPSALCAVGAAGRVDRHLPPAALRTPRVER